MSWDISFSLLIKLIISFRNVVWISSFNANSNKQNDKVDAVVSNPATKNIKVFAANNFSSNIICPPETKKKFILILIILNTV